MEGKVAALLPHCTRLYRYYARLTILREHQMPCNVPQCLPNTQVSKWNLRGAVCLHQHVKWLFQLVSFCKYNGQNSPISRDLIKQLPIQFQRVAFNKAKGIELKGSAKQSAVGSRVCRNRRVRGWASIGSDGNGVGAG